MGESSESQQYRINTSTAMSAGHQTHKGVPHDLLWQVSWLEIHLRPGGESSYSSLPVNGRKDWVNRALGTPLLRR